MATLRDLAGRFLSKPLDDLSPAYRRRVERARERGLPLKAARGHAPRPRPIGETNVLYGSASYEQSLHVVQRMRSGESLAEAARREGIRPETVRRQVGSALELEGRRYRAKPVDRLYRQFDFLTERGQIAVVPRDSREARKVAEYYNALRAYLERGDERRLRRFGRMRLRTRDKASLTFLTDLDVIDRLAAAGVLSFTSIYRLVS